jgi:hypothetical protein
MPKAHIFHGGRGALYPGVSRNRLELSDIYVIQVCGNVKMLAIKLRAHGLPVGSGGRDQLPLDLVADLDRHCKIRLIGYPTIVYGVSLLVEAQLQRGNRGMAQVLIENGDQRAAAVLAEVSRHISGHDGLVFEVLIIVMQ